jgi:hypothetical protein
VGERLEFRSPLAVSFSPDAPLCSLDAFASSIRAAVATARDEFETDDNADGDEAEGADEFAGAEDLFVESGTIERDDVLGGEGRIACDD